MAGDSDWTIHRGGAVTFEGVADVSLTDSTLSALGGNGILISNDAKNVELSNNTISDIGDSGVVVLGCGQVATRIGGGSIAFFEKQSAKIRPRRKKSTRFAKSHTRRAF